MTKEKAIEYLSDGHTIYMTEFAEKICRALDVPWNNKLVKKWYSDPPGTFKGLVMQTEGAEGVYSLTLSEYIAGRLGVLEKAGSYYGRGTQARAYAEEVAKKLKVKVK